ncbi:hypothetical protein MTR67_023693 [Solanum verrucosum]|uniref:Uncharacterized protein n=1 Tax=Solanum verrucosum TaxID=315347 RepID=A0AAF0TYQ5_SOLVR|nr:hypothetical protein MTR67_023693 [Solanum verrucosum]
MLSKALHDPTRISVTPPPPKQNVDQEPPVPPVQAPPPQSMNKLKVAGLRIILEEKRLCTDGVLDMYLDVWDTIRIWEVGSKGKKKASLFAAVDHVVRARVPFVVKTDMEVPLTFSTDIRRIKDEFTRDKAERRRVVSVDTSPVVDIEMLRQIQPPST